MNPDFLNTYQKLLFTKNSSSQQQCAALIHNYSLESLDANSTCTLLQQNLHKHCETWNLTKSTAQDRIQEILTQNNISKPKEMKSNLSQIDLNSLMQKPKCFKNTNSCAQSENIDKTQVDELINALQEPQNIPKNTSMDDTSAQFKRNVSEESTFKTARELLLNMKKSNGSSSSGSVNSKKRLGMTRTVNRRFISPQLSTKSEEITPKVEETDIDERLKNIDSKMIELIKSEIMDIGPSIEWNDIAGLEFAKGAIQEAVVWPMLRPDIFTGLRRPPKGILLFGPPGTGKTLIGKCVASQSKSTFFSISASSLTSKWVGDGEKMVRALFTVARCHQPAVIFIDEIDSLLTQRSENEHESSRRIKTEFLVQLDGATTENEERLLVIGATNRPQELDEAARRRFVKRLYIPLPEYKARYQLVKRLIAKEKHQLDENDFEEVAKLSKGYSGADIRTLCSEASLGPIRSIDISMIEKIQVEEVRPLLMNDFLKAFSRVKSSVSEKDLDQYVVWDRTFGSGL